MTKSARLDQLFKYFPAISCLNIQRDTSFIGVVSKPVQAFLRVRDVTPETAHPARRVTPGSLNLDDVGAQVSQYLAAQETLFVS